MYREGPPGRTCPDPATVDGLLESVPEFWDHWGFTPWQSACLRGVCREQRFVKDGLLGPVAEYKAWDCIVWQTGCGSDRDKLWRDARPRPDVMTQRFVFLLSLPWTRRRIRSFLLGIRGYVEFYAYDPLSGTGCGGARDLTGLVDMGLKLATGSPAETGSGP